MFKNLLPIAGVTLALLLSTAQPARADWLFTPFLGVTFGADAPSQKLVYGGAISYMGARVVGFELDAAITPDFLETDDGIDLDIADSNVSTVMANVIAGIPIGSGAGVRPYVSGGAGLIRTNVSGLDDLLKVTSNDFGVNLGGGVMIFPRDNFGIRVDGRYFRSVQDSDSSDRIDIGLGSFDFWRGTVGVTFKF